MIKKILVSACLLLSVFTAAQEGTYSPYSFYGIGDQRFKGTAEFRSMGGVSIFADSIHVNLQNPASFSALKLTTFTAGGSFSSARLHTETQQEKAQRTTLDYFAVALPAGKAGFSFGLMPYTSVGYKVVNSSPVVEDLPSAGTFTGTGGVNRVFLGMGYEIFKNFRAGIDVSYHFGSVDTQSTQTVGGISLSTREENSSEIRGFNTNLGLMYERVFGKYKGFAGLTYSPETSLKTDNFRKLQTIQQVVAGDILYDEQIIEVPDGEMILPSKVTFGLGVGVPLKWEVGAEIAMQGSSKQANRFTDIRNVAFEDAIKYSIGGFYIPNYNSYASYLSRITYRFGARHEKTGMVLAGKSIFDTGVTAGVGLPITGTFSNVNIGLEYGKRGTVFNGLIEENYFNVSIGLSFNDRWFLKRKYD